MKGLAGSRGRQNVQVYLSPPTERLQLANILAIYKIEQAKVLNFYII